MTKFKFQIAGIIFLLAAIAAVSAIFFINRRYQPAVIDVPKIDNKKPVTASTSPDTTNKQDPKPPILKPIPNTFLLSVPFTSQAPTANWDELHNEACEEASVIMAAEYFSGNESSTLTAAFVEKEITKLTEWQDNAFGYHLSIDTAETVKMIKEVYGLNAEILENFDEETLKKTLTDGKLIIFPANGRLLGNPNFKSPGPIYHMLVIKGFTSQSFITNDPGTRKGQNYPYSFDVLYNANGDYSHETKEVDRNKKMVIAVWNVKRP